ncbi:MAG: prolyl oligopeptidase family serine peptidase [Epsilonproteobacteria bacterium]|nr:prolyl oligopeptidase family serine peptidase [Campylobacterota bacterium]
MKRLLVLFIAFFIAGCGGSSDPGEIEEVKVVGGELIADYPANLLKNELVAQNKISPEDDVFGFRAYKIYYKTTDANGVEVNASGVMVVPTAVGASESVAQKLLYMQQVGLGAVVDCHGTIFANKEAPSVKISQTLEPDGAPIIFTSLAGFISLQPDYIGFGESKEHIQEYLIKKSSASSVVDFINAAKEFAKNNNIPWANGYEFYLTGYSQGGYVSMAALKELEKNDTSVLMAAPMAGPYLLDPIAKGVLSLEEISAPSFMAAVGYFYSKVYNYPVTQIIKEPYASKLDTLFSGEYSREEIDKELTTKVKELFSDEILYTYELSWFRLKLVENSVVDFAPKTPVKMVHCLGDDIIPYQISEASFELFSNVFGASDIELLALEDILQTSNRYSHTQCAPYAYSLVAKIFAQDRKVRLGY